MLIPVFKGNFFFLKKDMFWQLMLLKIGLFGFNIDEQSFMVALFKAVIRTVPIGCMQDTSGKFNLFFTVGKAKRI